MNMAKICPEIRWVRVNDRTTDLFEGLWLLRHGVSYNAELVADEKVAQVGPLADMASLVQKCMKLEPVGAFSILGSFDAIPDRVWPVGERGKG